MRRSQVTGVILMVQHRSRLTAIGVLAGALALSSLVIPGTAAGQAEDAGGAPPRACDMLPAGTMPEAGSSDGPMTPNKGTEWLLSPEAQARVNDAHAFLDSTQSRHSVDAFVHFAAEKLVFVLDPDLDAATAATLTTGLHARGGSVVAVAKGCSGFARLKQVQRGMADNRGLATEAQSLSIKVDAQSGRVVARAKRPEVVQNFVRQRGWEDIVVQEPAEVRYNYAGDRFGDTAPHWGGARVISNESYACTAAAPLRIDHNGARRTMMLTAGHCSGQAWNSGLSYSPSTPYYGSAQHRRYTPASAGDLLLLGGTGDPYVSTFWTTPDTPSTRQFVGTQNLEVGHGACLSGAETGAVCGAVVTGSGYSPDQNGVYARYAVAERAGYGIAQPRDSGAPAYGRTGTTSANFRGVLIGGPCPGRCPTAYIQTTNEVLYLYRALRPEFPF